MYQTEPDTTPALNMDVVPEEIWTDVLDYLEPLDLVSCQGVSRRLLKLARDSSLWRNKVFEKAPSATHSHAANPHTLSTLTGALGGLSLGEPSVLSAAGSNASSNNVSRSWTSRRARAVLEWDKTHPSEKIDWYSEYIARHAPLTMSWAKMSPSNLETRGMALFRNGEKVIGTVEDGSLSIWDIEQLHQGRRKFKHLYKSRSYLLFEDMYSLGESSQKPPSKPLGASVESISTDSSRNRAFVAVQNTLNEVDLTRMKVISQNKFAWPITALSQGNEIACDLTVGTSYSLHIYDARTHTMEKVDNSTRVDVVEDSKIAFLQNYAKEFGIQPPEGVESSTDVLSDYLFTNRIEAYARVEPGPQSILHTNDHEIIIAGRMPSILFYDRRTFPKPRTAIHSGARLSTITSLPVPPTDAAPDSPGTSTLIACGEYGGRGSLEIYELPWDRESTFRSPSPGSSATIPSFNRPFSSKNRQEASSSKLLSVATQGARIVFSDSEGTLKWVERDGRGLARRWNINAYHLSQYGATVSGDRVARKILALPEHPNERGTRGDGDLLVWTGEKIGIVTTKPLGTTWNSEEDLVEAFERGMDLNDPDDDSGYGSENKDREMYSSMMRRALERQADERRWMSRFNVRR